MVDNKKSKDVHKRTRENQKIAQELTDQIKALANEATTKEKQISTVLTGIAQQSEESTAIQNEIATIKATITTAFDAYNAEKDKVVALLQEITTFQSGQFNPVRQQFLDAQQGVGALVEQANQKHQAISSLEAEASEQSKLLKQQVVEFQSKLEAFNKVEAAINDLHTKSQDPKTGIAQRLKEVQATKGQIDELSNQVKESHRISSDLANEIKSLHEGVLENLENLKEAEGKSLDIQERIDTIYKSVVPKMKGGWFDKTRKSFQFQQMVWLVMIVISILATTYVAYTLYDKFGSDPDSTFINVFLRYATISPLIFLIVFSARQYRMARLSYEKYTFKTVLSISLPADIEILRDMFEKEGERDPEIMQFALDKLYSLYDEPYYDEAMKMKDSIEQDQIRYGTESLDDVETDDSDKTSSNESADDSASTT